MKQGLRDPVCTSAEGVEVEVEVVLEDSKVEVADRSFLRHDLVAVVAVSVFAEGEIAVVVQKSRA